MINDVDDVSVFFPIYSHIGPLKSPSSSAGSSPGQPGKKSKGSLHSSSSGSNGMDGKHLPLPFVITKKKTPLCSMNI